MYLASEASAKSVYKSKNSWTYFRQYDCQGNNILFCTNFFQPPHIFLLFFKFLIIWMKTIWFLGFHWMLWEMGVDWNIWKILKQPVIPAFLNKFARNKMKESLTGMLLAIVNGTDWFRTVNKCFVFNNIGGEMGGDNHEVFLF